MSADVLLDIDPLVIEELDAPIPCEGVGHARGIMGHEPSAPAAYLQVHRACSCPNRSSYFKCEGYRAWFVSTHDAMRCVGCGVAVPMESIRFIPITESSS